MASSPARLHVILARKGRRAVVFRRGPSDRVATLLWDRTRDTFTLGQWLHGRIYAYRADLSPDGSQLVYFAMNGYWQGEARGAWTAISRAPYLKATHLMPKGDCWHGGGLFDDRGRVWINEGYGHTSRPGDPKLQYGEAPPDAGRFGGECPGVYFPRLLRDGWSLVDRPKKDGISAIFERTFRGGVLRKRFHAGDPPVNRSVYYETHAVVSEDGAVAEHPDWEWADVDGDRLVFAAGGCLWALRRGESAPTLLHDFNPMVFEAVRAPY